MFLNRSLFFSEYFVPVLLDYNLFDINISYGFRNIKAAFGAVDHNLNDKCQVTATLAGTLSGELLPLQILYQGKTERCHPSQTFPNGCDIWHTPNHWANEETTLQENVILLHNENVRRKSSTPDQVALVIFDVFKGHICVTVCTLPENNKILQVHVPNNCTDLFQPLNFSVNKPFKDN